MGGGLVVGGFAGDGAMVIAHEACLESDECAGRQEFHRRLGGVADGCLPGRVRKMSMPTARASKLHHPAAAHTDGDSIVYFRRSDVVVAGDIFSMTSYPVIDTETRRKLQRRPRGVESHHRPDDPEGLAGGRHDGDSRPRADHR